MHNHPVRDWIKDDIKDPSYMQWDLFCNNSQRRATDFVAFIKRNIFSTILSTVLSNFLKFSNSFRFFFEFFSSDQSHFEIAITASTARLQSGEMFRKFSVSLNNLRFISKSVLSPVQSRYSSSATTDTSQNPKILITGKCFNRCVVQICRYFDKKKQFS